MRHYRSAFARLLASTLIAAALLGSVAPAMAADQPRCVYVLGNELRCI